jgi:multiple sugar transport system substrate-binding protein
MRRLVPVVLGAALVIGPVSARAADLVVWWEKGFYAQEDKAVADVIAAFEQDTGKKIELVSPPYEEVQDQIQAALAARQPPDFLFSTASERWAAEWAYEDRLADLEGALHPVLTLFRCRRPRSIELPRRQNGPAWTLRSANGPEI